MDRVKIPYFPREDRRLCPHETFTDGRWMRCELLAGHDGKHQMWAAARERPY